MKQFCTIASIGSMRKAAEIMRISHSGLSKSMRVLEQELSGELFQQDGRGIRLTDFGKEVFHAARDFQAAEQNFLNQLEKKQSPKLLLRIGSFEVFTTYFAGEMLEQGFNGYELELRELVPGFIEKAVYERKVDYGITYAPIPHPDLDFVKICQIEIDIFARNGAFAGLSWDQIPFCAPAIPIEGSPTNMKGLDGWPDHQYKRRIIYRVDMMETALDLVRRGKAAVYLPTFIARLHNRSVYEKLKLTPILSKPFVTEKRDVFLIKRSSHGEDAGFKKVAKALRQICKAR